jgi:dTDP-4-dehydrorhamnose reductase
MLGHVVARYLADAGHEVLTTDRRYEGTARDALVEEVCRSGASWVVNAAGRIKQKGADTAELMRVNAQLPQHLAVRLAPGQRLLQPSTDCVFAGRTGGYRTTDVPDAEDDYGLSKVLGDLPARPGCCQVVRVSMIGPEPGTGYSLLGWFFRQPGPVNGYVNHLWNGITTLEWSKWAARLIAGKWAPAAPVVQLASPRAVSKCELLQLVSQTWNRGITIHPVAAAESVDRTLVGDYPCPPLTEQLAELRAWYEARFGPVPMRSCQP